MSEYQVAKSQGKMPITLQELEEDQKLNTVQMAKKLGMSREEYSRARNGKPPKWFLRMAQTTEALLDMGVLPSQIKLAEKPTKYKTNQQ